jgi:hypothetical protein
MANYQNVTPVQIAQAALTTSYATLYTAPTNPTTPTRTYVKQIDVCNTTGSPITFNLHIVPATFSAATQNALFYGQTVAANSTFSYAGVQVMQTLSFISAKASTTGLTITISGGEAV